MRKRIDINALPDFDTVPYLDSEEAIVAYLTDILETNDACATHSRCTHRLIHKSSRAQRTEPPSSRFVLTQ